MLKIKFVILLYIMIVNFSIAYAQPVTTQQDESTDLVVQAEAAVLLDEKTGTVIYDKDKDKKFYPASVTKIMTTLLAIEYGKLDEIVTVSRNAVYGIEPGSSHIGMREDEQLTLEQALYAVMLMSANELSVAVAEHIDGTVEKFAEHMTKRAKELGATNTKFDNPHGLHSEEHYTTANDMALIMREALKHDEFHQIITTRAYKIPPTNKHEDGIHLANQHKMFRTDTKYHYEGIIGGKTGFTNQAMYTLATAATRDDLTLIAVVMKGQTLDSRYEDTINILNYGFENFQYKQIFDENDFSLSIPVEQKDGDEVVYSDTLEVYAGESIEMLVNKDLIVSDVKIDTYVPDIISDSVEMNDSVGTLNLTYKGDLLATVELFAKYSVVVPTIDKSSGSNNSNNDGEKDAITDFLPIILTVALIISILILLVKIKINSKQKII